MWAPSERVVVPEPVRKYRNGARTRQRKAKAGHKRRNSTPEAIAEQLAQLPVLRGNSERDVLPSTPLAYVRGRADIELLDRRPTTLPEMDVLRMLDFYGEGRRDADCAIM